MTYLRSLLGAVAVGVVLAPLASYAAEGRIPISGPTTISESGSYFLSQDIENAGGPAIVVAADHVTLDLDGHTIKVTGAYRAIETDRTDVEVRNGKLFAEGAGPTYGLFFVRPGGEFRARGLTIVGFQAAGILATGAVGGPSGACVTPARLIATGNTVQGHPLYGGYAGIYTECMEAMRIEGNDVRESSFVGIWLEGSADSIISNNVVSQNQDDGILLAWGSDNNTVERNTVTRNGGVGIHVVNCSANSIVHNNASKNTLAGVSIFVYLAGNVAKFNQVSYNTASFNSGSGIVISAAATANTLDWNNAAGNSPYGIQIQGTGNLYSNNRALGNSTGGYSVVGGNVNVVINTSPTVTPTNY